MFFFLSQHIILLSLFVQSAIKFSTTMFSYNCDCGDKVAFPIFCIALCILFLCLSYIASNFSSAAEEILLFKSPPSPFSGICITFEAISSVPVIVSIPAWQVPFTTASGISLSLSSSAISMAAPIKILFFLIQNQTNKDNFYRKN